VEARFNKLTVGEVLYHGIGFRKEATKRNIYLSPLLGLINFEVIGGFRLGPFASYFRKFDNGRMLSVHGAFSLGLKNLDWNGNLGVWTRYNPYRLGDFSVRIGRTFYSVNSFDAYLNQLRISNYILHRHVDLFHRIELFNGFYVSAELGFHDRHSVQDYDRTSIINEVIREDEPLAFENYQALITSLRVAYTPGQKFMTEPNQKVVLGSRYPTFSVAHRKGWNRLLTSDIDFDYFEAGHGTEPGAGHAGQLPLRRDGRPVRQHPRPALRGPEAVPAVGPLPVFGPTALLPVARHGAVHHRPVFRGALHPPLQRGHDQQPAADQKNEAPDRWPAPG
jgi:hypothetical protein